MRFYCPCCSYLGSILSEEIIAFVLQPQQTNIRCPWCGEEFNVKIEFIPTTPTGEKG